MVQVMPNKSNWESTSQSEKYHCLTWDEEIQKEEAVAVGGTATAQTE
jgi:hypothetical protein